MFINNKQIYVYRSRILLCPYHFLRAQWQWICLDSHGIEPSERPAMFAWVKRLLNATTEAQLQLQ